MLWFLVALISALGQSGIEVFSKKSLENTSQLTVSFSIVFFALPFTIPILFLDFIPSSIEPIFWFVLLGSTVSTVLVLLLLIKSIQKSPLSVSIPMFALTPVFLLITSPLILQEFPSVVGIIGTLLIAGGIYFLHFNNKQSLVSPFKFIWNEKGPLYALLAAFVIGLGANFDKIGVQTTNPIFWIVSVNILSSLILGLIILFRNKSGLKEISTNVKYLFIIGGMTAITQISLMYAFTMTLIPYAVAVKRSSILFSSIFGFRFFKESFSFRKLFSIIVMLLGMTLILLPDFYLLF